MNYLECTNYLENFYSRRTNRTANSHLLIMKELLDLFKIEIKKFEIIQLTGSCGKGSTAKYISEILSQNNITHGLFTGPHLSCYEERFVVNRNMIPTDLFCEIVTTVACALEDYPKEKEVGHMHVMTLLAFLYFHHAGVKLVVFENGSGGQSDPSNVLHPVIAVLTEITLDHTHLLGNSIEEITMNKAAIIKEETKYVIAGMYNEKAKAILKEMEPTKNASFFYVDESYKSTFSQGTFIYRGASTFSFSLSFPAVFQQQNFTNAVCVIELLSKLGYEIKRKYDSGLQQTIIPGRMEWTQIGSENILLDGAHNEYELAALKYEIEEQNLKKPLFLIAFSSNKDIKEMIRAIALKEGFYIVVPSPFNERRIERQKVETAFQSLQLSYTYHEKIEQGLEDFMSSKHRRRTKIVTGSLYLIGFIKKQQTEGFNNEINNNETS